jgi:hypothetical protein
MADIVSLGADHWIEFEKEIWAQSLRSADWFLKTAGGGGGCVVITVGLSNSETKRGPSPKRFAGSG